MNLTAAGKSLAVRVFASCWLVHTFFWTPFIVREHFPALALIERGSFNVEKYLTWCEDIFPGPRGGAYINNNPGASLAGAIPLILVKPALERLEHSDIPERRTQVDDVMFQSAMADGSGRKFLLVAFATVAGVMAPATAFTAAFLGVRLLQAGIAPLWAAGIPLLYAFGTPVFFRAGYLNHNLLVSCSGFTALLLLWHPRQDALTTGRAAAAGLLSGFAILCDFTGLLVAAVVGAYVTWRAYWEHGSGWWRLSIAFAAGVVPGCVILLLYQWTAFGNPWRPSQHYMTPTAPTSRGYRGFDWPSPALLWANFFDPRFGLFAYCPLLVLSFVAPFLRNLRHSVPKRETVLILIYFFAFVLFSAANQYSWLQPNTGFRYLIPVVPLLLLLTVQTLQVLPPWLRLALVTATLLQSWSAAATRHHHVGESLRLAFTEGLRFVWVDRLVAMKILPVWGGWAVLIYLVLGAALAAIWFTMRGPAVHGRPQEP